MTVKAKFKAVPKRNPSKPEEPNLFYAQVVSKDTFDITKLATRIAEMSALTEIDVQAVLLGFTKVFPEMLREGNRIRLDGLGTFSLGVKSEGMDDEEHMKAQSIKKVRLKFAPDTRLKEALQQTKFEKVE